MDMINQVSTAVLKITEKISMEVDVHTIGVNTFQPQVVSTMGMLTPRSLLRPYTTRNIHITVANTVD